MHFLYLQNTKYMVKKVICLETASQMFYTNYSMKICFYFKLFFLNITSFKKNRYSRQSTQGVSVFFPTTVLHFFGVPCTGIILQSLALLHIFDHRNLFHVLHKNDFSVSCISIKPEHVLTLQPQCPLEEDWRKRIRLKDLFS